MCSPFVRRREPITVQPYSPLCMVFGFDCEGDSKRLFRGSSKHTQKLKKYRWRLLGGTIVQ